MTAYLQVRSIDTPAAAAMFEGRHAIEGLQYLRAVAALMVVFHHARWYFPPDCILYTAAWSEVGSRGVDIFFVISGFVMAHSTLGFDPDRPRLSQSIDFFVKRAIRVVPLYWIATLTVGMKALATGRHGLELRKDFLFVPHFNDQGLIWPSLFQGWTINYEMFFYALFALSMLAGRWRFHALSLSLLALTTLGVISTVTHAETHSAANIFYTSNLLFEFVMGVWLYLWMLRHPVRVPRPALACITITGLCLLAVPNGDNVRGFADGLVAMVIVGSTVLWAQGTALGWLHRLGDASYSIYLFHMTFFTAAAWLFHSAGWVTPSLAHMVLVIVCYLVLASALGVLVHQALEKPMLHRLRRWHARLVAS